MRVVVIGSGPTGLLAGAALARRGHDVVSVDRDPGPSGPSEDSAWRRRGVMQFEHAHGFRSQVGRVLHAEWPAAYDAWLARGATPIDVDASPGDPADRVVLSRRSTFERALRASAVRRPGLALRAGHVDGLVLEHGRVVGVSVDGAEVRADLVVDASGRASRIRPVGESGRSARRDSRLVGDWGIGSLGGT